MQQQVGGNKTIILIDRKRDTERDEQRDRQTDRKRERKRRKDKERDKERDKEKYTEIEKKRGMADNKCEKINGKRFENKQNN